MEQTLTPPFSSPQIMIEDSRHSPSTVHIHNTRIAAFYRKYLFQKAISVFEWKNMPATWDLNYFLYWLYGWGYICVLNTDKFGIIPQQCGLSGFNIYYKYNRVLVTNPLFGGRVIDLEIGKQTELFQLQYDYSGILDIVSFYGDLMALAAEAAQMNLINSEFGFVFGAQDKAAAETMKKAYDRLHSGEPAVFVGKNLFDEQGKPLWQPFNPEVKQNFITPELLMVLRRIEAMFDTDIGIPNANTDKKERQIVDEVNANNIETYAKCCLWLQNLQECCTKVNKMFGLKLSVNWRFKPEEVEKQNVSMPTA